MKRKTFLSRNNYTEIAPPKDGDTFEELCLDIFPLFLERHNVKIINEYKKNYSVRHGVSGDKQFGVDLKDYASYATAQCKNTKSLTPGDIKAEIETFAKYDDYSSIHFIFSSLKGATAKTQNYIQEQNHENAKKLEDLKKFPTKPNECLPKIIFVNWSEINEAIYSSFPLSVKWGALPFIMSKYPALTNLDIELLEKLCSNATSLKRESILIRGTESKDSFLAMTRSINIQSILDFKISAKISSATFDGIIQFLKDFDRAMSAASRIHETKRLCSSQDGIEMLSGIEQLNDTTNLINRIRIAPFTHKLYNLLCTFISSYDNQELYTHPEILLNYSKYDGHYVEDTSIRIYQFIEGSEAEECLHEQISKKELADLSLAIAKEHKNLSSILLKD